MEVRAAGPADRGALCRLLGAAMGAGTQEDAVARAVELALAPRATAWLAVALRGGTCAGVALANPIVSPGRGGAALRLETLYVAPVHRRRGLGRALVLHLRGEARANGLGVLELAVPAGDDAALAFARALGFVEERSAAMVLV